jgi:formylglycine-generating enzyme required for sulfatase activity
MDSFSLLATAFILALATATPLCAQNDSVVWTTNDGRTTRGSFVKLAGDSVVIRVGNYSGSSGKEETIPLAKLLPASRELAQRLAAGQKDPALGIALQMKFCRAGVYEFQMGSTQPTSGTRDDENLHEVKINPFYLKETEVTWSEWNAVRGMAANYGYTDISVGRNGFNGDASGTHPVTEVSWWDAIKWCNLMSQIQGKTPVYYTAKDHVAANILKTGTPEPCVNWDANGFRLPTEAEWESACYTSSHEGTKNRYAGNIASVAWYAGNSENNTHPVGDMVGAINPYQKLSDMLGNVAEWCWDWEGPLAADARNPRGPASGGYRIIRGGCWADKAWCCRISYRGGFSPAAPRSCFVGFRPACKNWP